MAEACGKLLGRLLTESSISRSAGSLAAATATATAAAQHATTATMGTVKPCSALLNTLCQLLMQTGQVDSKEDAADGPGMVAAAVGQQFQQSGLLKLLLHLINSIYAI